MSILWCSLYKPDSGKDLKLPLGQNIAAKMLVGDIPIQNDYLIINSAAFEHKILSGSVPG